MVDTYSRLQFSYLIAGLAELLQHLMQLLLQALTIHLFILKVLGRELDLQRSSDVSGGKDGNIQSCSTSSKTNALDL